MVDEGLPERVQDVFYSLSFEHGDIGPFLHDSEREAGVNGPAIHRHRAGAITAFVRTGEVEMIAKRIGANVSCPLLPVDIERYRAPIVGTGPVFVRATVVACVMSKPFSVTSILIEGTKWVFLF